MNVMLDRRLGVLFGSAFGDALGRPTEFMHMDALNKLGSPFNTRIGIHTGPQGIVTDDTQMAIAVAHAALVRGEADRDNLTWQFVKFFTMWMQDPASMDGRRAPGITCVTSVHALMKIAHVNQWVGCPQPRSKGNGANMRVAPLALRTDWSWEGLAAASQLQAAMTHGHPTALAAAHLTAVAVRMLLTGYSSPGEELIEDLIGYAADQRRTYYGAWLGSVWDAWSGKFSNPVDYIEHGWREVLDALLRIYARDRNPKQDPCEVAGEGWVAEEALACALHVLACLPDDPANALRRAAFSNGDSDSIGAITGALVGAAHGLSAFPKSWSQNIEYARELRSLGLMMHSASG